MADSFSCQDSEPHSWYSMDDSPDKGTQTQPPKILYLEEVVQGVKSLCYLFFLTSFHHLSPHTGCPHYPPVMNPSCISFPLGMPSSTRKETFGATNRIRIKTPQAHPPVLTSLEKASSNQVIVNTNRIISVVTVSKRIFSEHYGNTGKGNTAL